MYLDAEWWGHRAFSLRKQSPVHERTGKTQQQMKKREKKKKNDPWPLHQQRQRQRQRMKGKTLLFLLTSWVRIFTRIPLSQSARGLSLSLGIRRSAMYQSAPSMRLITATTNIDRSLYLLREGMNEWKTRFICMQQNPKGRRTVQYSTNHHHHHHAHTT